MNRIIKMWLGRLETGSYEQCAMHLRKGRCRCITGVLCDVLIECVPGVYEWKGNAFHEIATGRTASKCLDISILKAIGLDNEIMAAAMDMNDKGISFKKIAAFLRGELEEVPCGTV